MEIDVVLAYPTEGYRKLKTSLSITAGRISTLKSNIVDCEIDSDHILLKLKTNIDDFTHVYFHKDNEINLDVRSFGDGAVLPVLTFIVNEKSYGIVLEDSLETILGLWRWNRFLLLDLIKKYNNRTKSTGRQEYITQLINELKILKVMSSEDELYLEIGLF